MTDLTVLFEILGTIALIVVPTVALTWLLAGADGPTLTDIFAVPAGPPLPRGVQEEEPVRYRVERLTPAPRPGCPQPTDSRYGGLEVAKETT